jgi:tRNA ligase
MMSSSSEDSQLIVDLIALSKNSPKLVKSSVYPAPSDPNLLVTSWKMNEFKYYEVPSPFPTYARGLFTLELQPARSYRIVARGYDKFFNIGEVPWTEWSFLESHTSSPYVLSLKSNGCIIFVAALTPSKLIVTSKHSIGPIESHSRSHAEVGESWLRRYIDEKGRTEAEMAQQLWDNNWTAIAELCDDSFEEHILPYPPEKTGLYLHGLNTCTKAFNTMLPSTVDAFAEEWGFVKTTSVTMNSIREVRDFTDELRKTGTWRGEPIEGFVVRTHVTDPPSGTGTSSPYKSGSTFFFKIKFDEPYLLYRDWREVTKSLLSMQAKTGHMNPNNLPKSRMSRYETKLYVDWAIGEIKRNPEAFSQYQNNKGIIKTREMFLDWLSANMGKTVDRKEEEPTKPNQGEFVKTIIVPVAIPGSGKTAVSLALSHIFKFAHTQSDDVRASKKPGSVFVKNVMNLLRSHDVVIADKNNHLRQHRAALREESTKLFGKSQKTQKGKRLADDGSESNDTPARVRLLALYWETCSKPEASIFQTCAERVRARGANHQTLRASPPGGNSHEDVIWKFIRESEELSLAEVDAIIEMPFDESLEGNVKHAVHGIVQELGLPMPDEQTIQQGLDSVKEYKVAEESKRRVEADGNTRTKRPPRYYGFLPELDIRALLDPVFQSADADADGASFWDHLKKGRLTPQPHVTIVHTKELPDSQALWDRCEGLIGHDVYFRLSLTHVIWNDRVMALAVDVAPEEQEDLVAQGLAVQYLSSLTALERQRLHVTIGTRDGSVLPVEARALVKGWRDGEEEEDKERRVLKLGEGDVTVKARIAGLFS